jgi:hypothetical protein
MQGQRGSLFHDKDIEEMWGLLRSAVLFYLRPFDEEASDDDHSDEDVGDEDEDEDEAEDSELEGTGLGDADGPSCSGIGGVPEGGRRVVLPRAYVRACQIVYKRLFQYGVLAQQLFGSLLCKNNLHSCLCSLPVQQGSRGHAFYYTEFWLEQLMQWAKHATKFRTTGCPEKLIMGCILVRLALDRCAAESVLNLSMGGWVDKMRGVARADTYAGKHLDLGEGGRVGLLGSGVEVDVESGGSEAEECRRALDTYFTEFTLGAWTEQDMDEAKMAKYKRAQLEGGEIIHSSAYDRATSRVSSYVSARYEETLTRKGSTSVEEVRYVGHVRYFLKVTPTAQCMQGGGRVLRFACADMYKADVVQGPLGEILYANGMCGGRQKPLQKAYPVALSAVEGKVVRCQEGALATLSESRKVAFVPYSHVPSPLE